MSKWLDLSLGAARLRNPTDNLSVGNPTPADLDLIIQEIMQSNQEPHHSRRDHVL